MGPGNVTQATRVARGLVSRLAGREPSRIGHLVIAARRWPDRAAVVDASGMLTFTELHERVRDLAGVLHARGVGPGRSVGLLCREHAGMVETALAVTWVEADLVMLDPALAAEQLDAAARAGRPDLLVHDADLVTVVARAHLGIPTLVSDAHGSGSVTSARFFGHPAPPPRRVQRRSGPGFDHDVLAAAMEAITTGHAVVLTRPDRD